MDNPVFNFTGAEMTTIEIKLPKSKVYKIGNAYFFHIPIKLVKCEIIDKKMCYNLKAKVTTRK